VGDRVGLAADACPLGVELTANALYATAIVAKRITVSVTVRRRCTKRRRFDHRAGRRCLGFADAIRVLQRRMSSSMKSRVFA
jgi:hypothetical protein